MNGFHERIMNSVPHVHRSGDWQPMLKVLRLLRILKLNFHLNLRLKLLRLLKPTLNPTTLTPPPPPDPPPTPRVRSRQTPQ